MHRAKAVLTIPFKFNCFVGAQRFPFADALERALSVLHCEFEQVQGEACLFRYKGKLFRFVKCMLANNNPFVKGDARFRPAGFEVVS